jgi:signal transduction histidine kinase
MTSWNVTQPRQHSEKLWLPSLLLVAWFLTITPVLFIIFADEQHRNASDASVALLDGLDRLSVAIADLENIPRSGAAAGAAWQQQYGNYRAELKLLLSSPAAAPRIRETLARIDGMVAATEFGNVRSEILDVQRLIRLQRSTAGSGITRMTAYLKALVSGACLLAFGVVLVIRKFRRDAAIQRKLQRELETTNEEVIAALASARSESEAKSHFLGKVGRLMEAPLNEISWRTEELLQADLTGQQHDWAQSGRDSAESLRKIALQVMDYSSLESGSFELHSVEFEPAEIVTDVLELFSPLAERKGLKLLSDTAKGWSSPVKGDADRLRQVLANLMSNAIRFTERGEILLRAEDTIGATGRTTLRFEIRDTGIGIPEQARDRIFEPFTQVRRVLEGNEGPGLGLAISKKLVELMGGKIDVASQPGQGSTFWFTAVFESVAGQSESQPKTSEAAAACPDTEMRPSTPAIGQKSMNGKKGGRERRIEPRHGINYPTLLRSEQAGIAIIRILDVSISGLRVSVPFRLNLHSEVEIRIEGRSVIGIVRNCTCIRPNEFHVGIAIRPASAGDEQFLVHLRLLRSEQRAHR